MSSKKRICLSINDKILMLVSSFSQMKNEWEMPFTLTQQGIADSLNIARCNVSRALTKMMVEGVITERKAHIKGIRRMRNVYLPSTTGLVRVQELSSSLEGMPVPFVTSDGRTEQRTLSEIHKMTGGEYGYLELYDVFKKKGQITLRGIKKHEDKFVSLTERSPTITNFFGRKEEKRIIEEWLPKSPVIIIRGIAGIGKTTLAGKVVEEYRSRKNIFWFRLHEWTTIRYALEQIGNFLSLMGRPTVSSMLSSRRTLGPEDLLQITDQMIHDLSDQNAMIVLDDVHKAEARVSDLITHLVTEVFRQDPDAEVKLNFILVTRNRLSMVDMLRLENGSRLQELVLEGLDERASLMLVKAKTRNQSQFEKIFQMTNGHPLSLQLMDTPIMDRPDQEAPSDQAIGTGPLRDLNRFVYEEIFQNISKGERELLDRLCVFRYPILRSWVLNKGTKRTLESLVGRSLISESDNAFAIHDLVRTFLYSRLKPSELAVYHRGAGALYLAQTKYRFDIDASNEVLYHYRTAGDFKFLSNFITGVGEDYINKGYVEELSVALKDLEEEKVGQKDWTKILFLKSRLLEITGELSSAQDYLKYTMSVCQRQKDQFTLAKAHNLLGVIKTNQGDWQDALQHFDEAHKAISKLPMSRKDLKAKFRVENLRAEVFRNIGAIHWRNGNWDLAKSNWDRALEHASKVQGQSTVAEVLIDMGNLYKDQGMWEEGMRRYQEALTTLLEMGEKQKMMRVYLNMGALCVHMERLDEAITWLKCNLEIAKRTGALKSQAWTSFNLAEAYAKKGDIKEAQEYSNGALAIASKLNDPLAVSYSYRVMGIIERTLGEWSKSVEHFKASISILEGLNARYHLAEAYLEFGLLYKKMGNTEKMRQCLTKSQALFKDLGNETYLKKVTHILKEAKD